jgi:hypothetical protein
MQPSAEAQLLQYHAAQQPSQSFSEQSQQIHHGHQHAQSASFPLQQSMSFSHESPYMQPQDPTYAQHVRVGSVPVQSGAEAAEDKRRKGSAATATNDKELREMLAKNEGRPLRDVAQEVIQKERTPMAEKTKQLFAMLWCVSSLRTMLSWYTNFSSGFALYANRQRPVSHATESTRSTPTGVVQSVSCRSIQLRSASLFGSSSLAFRHDD